LRQLGTLPKNIDAKIFSDYLLTLGMKSRVDENPEGWSLWIYNEDHLERAREELRGYLSRPEDPCYRDAVEAAKAIRRHEQQLSQQFRKNYQEVSDLWAYPGLRRRPLTVALVVVCLIVFLLQESPRVRPVLVHELGFSTSYTDPQGHRHGSGFHEIFHGEVWRLVTPIFLHFGIWHLLFNMWAFSSFGTVIEQRKGTVRLAGMVLIAAIASNVGQYMYMERHEPGEPGLFGGMSGVICALFGYLWMKSYYDPEQGMILSPNTVVLVLAWIVLCMTGAITGVVGHVANAAHVVGLIVGVAIGALRL
jgi:GlpG protein